MPAASSQNGSKGPVEIVDLGRRSRWWRRCGGPRSGFRYVDAEGKAVTESCHIERISSLVIPPAWKHVRVCPAAGGRLQAVGVDAAERVQYLYHERFRRRKDREKFERIEEFGRHLPQLREATNRDIMLDGFPRDKVLAICLRLINSLYFRVGDESSVKRFRTYGITTLKNEHLEIGNDGALRFNFPGKGGIQQRKVLVDDEMAHLMRQLRKLGVKRKLFNYLDDDGKPRPIKATQVNRYLKSVTDSKFSAKDFRTWGATLRAAIELAEIGAGESEAEIKRNIVEAVKRVAADLGNTPAVCRSSYIHPAVISAYEQWHHARRRPPPPLACDKAHLRRL